MTRRELTLEEYRANGAATFYAADVPVITSADLARQREEFALDGAEDRPFHFIAHSRHRRGLSWNGGIMGRARGILAQAKLDALALDSPLGIIPGDEQALRLARLYVHELPFERTGIGADYDGHRWAMALRKGR